MQHPFPRGDNVASETDAFIAPLPSAERLDGLTNEEARERLQRWGPNEDLSAAESLCSVLRRVIYGSGRLPHPSIVVLFCLWVTSLATASWPNAVLVGFYIILHITIAVFESVAAFRARSRARRQRSSCHPVRALRSGVWEAVPQTEVVVGDAIALSTEERVPADVQLVFSSLCRSSEEGREAENEGQEQKERRKRVIFVDESRYTGESLLSEKTEGDVVFRGTQIVGSSTSLSEALGIVVRTGRHCALIDCARHEEAHFSRALSFRVDVAVSLFAVVTTLALVVGQVVRGGSPVPCPAGLNASSPFVVASSCLLESEVVVRVLNTIVSSLLLGLPLGSSIALSSVFLYAKRIMAAKTLAEVTPREVEAASVVSVLLFRAEKCISDIIIKKDGIAGVTEDKKREVMLFGALASLPFVSASPLAKSIVKEAEASFDLSAFEVLEARGFGTKGGMMATCSLRKSANSTTVSPKAMEKMNSRESFYCAVGLFMDIATLPLEEKEAWQSRESLGREAKRLWDKGWRPYVVARSSGRGKPFRVVGFLGVKGGVHEDAKEAMRAALERGVDVKVVGFLDYASLSIIMKEGGMREEAIVEERTLSTMSSERASAFLASASAISLLPAKDGCVDPLRTVVPLLSRLFEGNEGNGTAAAPRVGGGLGVGTTKRGWMEKERQSRIGSIGTVGFCQRFQSVDLRIDDFEALPPLLREGERAVARVLSFLSLRAAASFQLLSSTAMAIGVFSLPLPSSVLICLALFVDAMPLALADRQAPFELEGRKKRRRKEVDVEKWDRHAKSSKRRRRERLWRRGYTLSTNTRLLLVTAVVRACVGLLGSLLFLSLLFSSSSGLSSLQSGFISGNEAVPAEFRLMSPARFLSEFPDGLWRGLDSQRDVVSLSYDIAVANAAFFLFLSLSALFYPLSSRESGFFLRSAPSALLLLSVVFGSVAATLIVTLWPNFPISPVVIGTNMSAAPTPTPFGIDGSALPFTSLSPTLVAVVWLSAVALFFAQELSKVLTVTLGTSRSAARRDRCC